MGNDSDDRAGALLHVPRRNGFCYHHGLRSVRGAFFGAPSHLCHCSSEDWLVNIGEWC